ncbi:MAG TPA: hypothetical protein VGF09_06945 [Solirubrobacterales bacterium]|jgi:hypothetical protein
MSGAVEDDRLRVEELERVNDELAAEIRSLTLGHATGARSSLLGATRRVATIGEERDRAVSRLEDASAEIVHLRELNVELHRQVEAQVRELERLRAGPLGILRRAKASYLRGRATRDGGA